MELFLNGEKINYPVQNDTTWEQMTEELLKSKIKPNHGIVKITVDGREDFACMFERKSEIIPDTIKVVEFYTKDLAAITSDGFLKAKVLISDMKAEILKTAEFFRQGEVQDASKRLISVFEAFSPLISFINTVGQSFVLDFTKIAFDDNYSIRGKIESFLKTFEDLVKSQEKKDYIELADFLEYQLLDDMSGWEKIVATLQASLAGGKKAES